MNQEKIGLFIKEKRQEKNLTQKDLASKLHITTQAISKWERGKGIPDISMLEDLSKVLEVSIIEILKGEEQDDKDDKNVLESLGYGSTSTIQTFRSKLMKVCWLILLIAICWAILPYVGCKILRVREFSIKDDYFYNAKELSKINKEVHEKIDIIKSNQGNYSDAEYKIILDNIEIYEILFSDDELINEGSSKTINYTKVVNLLKKFETKILIQDVSEKLEKYNIIITGRRLANGEDIMVTTLLGIEPLNNLSNFEWAATYPAGYGQIEYGNPAMEYKAFIYAFILVYNNIFNQTLLLGGYNE